MGQTRIHQLVSVSFSELCQLEGIEGDVIIEMVEYGIAVPLAGVQVSDWVFDPGSVHWMKRALRLYRDFEIDWVAVALLIDLMQQRDSLQRENERYQCQLRRFVDNGT